MVFYIVGLGLGDEKDITVRGLEVVKACSKVWLENYTSILGVDPAALVRARTRARARSLSCIPSTHADIRWTRAQESFYGRPVEIADREMVEGEADSIYRGADESDVALLIVGDPFW